MSKLEEKTRILNMVQDGKLSAQDAIQLLEALEASSNEQSDEKYELLPIQADGRDARPQVGVRRQQGAQHGGLARVFGVAHQA